MNKKLFKGLMWVVGALLVLSTVTFITGNIGEVAQVAQKEFGAKASLKKYEWFIDTSAELDRMSADITLFEHRLIGCDRATDRIAREQCMMWQQETLGVKSSYNDVVAEYNAASRKFNWSMYDTENIQTTYKRK